MNPVITFELSEELASQVERIGSAQGMETGAVLDGLLRRGAAAMSKPQKPLSNIERLAQHLDQDGPGALELFMVILECALGPGKDNG